MTSERDESDADDDAVALRFAVSATFISMISIALGVQTGLLSWRAFGQPGSSVDVRAFRA